MQKLGNELIERLANETLKSRLSNALRSLTSANQLSSTIDRKNCQIFRKNLTNFLVDVRGFLRTMWYVMHILHCVKYEGEQTLFIIFYDHPRNFFFFTDVSDCKYLPGKKSHLKNTMKNLSSHVDINFIEPLYFVVCFFGKWFSDSIFLFLHSLSSRFKWIPLGQ